VVVSEPFTADLFESDDGIWATDSDPKGGLKLPRYCNVKLLTMTALDRCTSNR
jgi:hypothetical protein